MTARSPSSEALARLPCVHPDDRRDPRYVGDAAIRAYRILGLARLLADLDWPADTPAVRLTGGIGSLLLQRGAVPQWHAARDPLPVVTPITREQVEGRNAICHACPHYRADSDRCGLCGCAFVLLERVRSSLARCPEDRW